MKRRGEARKVGITPCRPNQRNTNWESGFGERIGHRDSRQIKQVSEIRVVAEIGIEPDWIGQYLIDSISGTCSRHNHKFDCSPVQIDRMSQFLPPMLRLEQVDRAVAAALFQNVPNYGMDFAAMCIEEFLEFRSALGNPRPIQQTGDFDPRCKVYF